MNRGSARKWIELMVATESDFNTGHIRAGDDCFDPHGLLADFLDPDGWKHNGLQWTHQGEIAKLSPSLRKKTKMKSEYGISDFVDELNQFRGRKVNWNECAWYVALNYEDI